MNNYREQQYYRVQRRAEQRESHGYHKRGLSTLIVVLIIIGVTAHLWVILPLILFMFPLLLFWIMPAMFVSMMYQTPYQQQVYQPYRPQIGEKQVAYQPYQQPEPEQPAYQPYAQGYQPQPSSYQQPIEAYEERSQPEYQNQQAQQYEELMTMYPQE